MTHSKDTVCSACGQRYRWDVSGPMMLLMLALIASSVIGFVVTAQQINAGIVLACVVALIGASAYLAVCAMRPVLR